MGKCFRSNSGCSFSRNLSRLGVRSELLGGQAALSSQLSNLGRSDASLRQGLGLATSSLDQGLLNTGTQLRTNWALNAAQLNQGLAAQGMNFTNLLQNQLNRSIAEQNTALSYGLNSDRIGMQADLGIGSLMNQAVGNQIRWDSLLLNNSLEQDKLNLARDQFDFNRYKYEEMMRTAEAQNRAAQIKLGVKF